jgi:hypothetical protein
VEGVIHLLRSRPGSGRQDSEQSKHRDLRIQYFWRGGNKKMRINLTKKQYITLIKLVYLGEWVVNAHRTGDRVKEFEEFDQYILSFCKDFNLEGNITYDEKLKMFFLTSEFIDETGLDDYIDEYDENTFWDELIYRLSRRDLIDRYGEEAVKNMKIEELIDKEQVFIEEYEEEFRRNGINNLVIGKDYGPVN